MALKLQSSKEKTFEVPFMFHDNSNTDLNESFALENKCVKVTVDIVCGRDCLRWSFMDFICLPFT